MFNIPPYLNMFLTFVVIAVVLLFRLKRRRYFFFTVIPLITIFGVGLYLIDTYVNVTSAWLNLIPLVCLFIVLYAGIDVSVFEAAFFAVMCYAVQNCQINISAILAYCIEMNDTVIFIVNQVILLVLMVILYFAFIRRLDSSQKVINNPVSAITSLVILVVAIFLNYFVRDTENTTDVITRCLLVLVVFAGLIIAFAASSNKNIRQEKEAIEDRLEQEKELYAISKDNSELLNLKYHDLKHFILDMRDAEVIDEKMQNELASIEEMVKTYECLVKTGNEDLDLVLSEKGLKCSRNNISLNIIADGRILSFMDPGDIYSLFGNAIDNAVNSVISNEDVKQRYIDINVRNVAQFVSIRIENYSSNNVVFENGYPVSSDRKRSHYGVKSMRYLVEKYDGNIVMEKTNGIFVVSIMIPIPDTENRKETIAEIAADDFKHNETF